VLPPDEVAVHLEDRLAKLEVQAAGIRGVLQTLHDRLPRLFLIETEYQLHMIEAETEWVRSFRKDLLDGSVGGQQEWESWHRTGELPQDWKDLEEQSPRD